MFYFLLKPYVGPKQANYQHQCIVFAEGLQNLNKKFSANIDYYPDISNNYLFKQSVLIPPVTEYLVTSHPEDFTAEINNSRNLKLIIFDSKDEWVRPTSIKYLPFAHRYYMTTLKTVTDRIKPLCFAASDRMITATASTKEIPWLERSEEIFWSHRVDNHRLRNIVKDFYDKKSIPYYKFLDNFVSPDEAVTEEEAEAKEAVEAVAVHLWNHTGRRHSPKYFESLRKFRYMDAHGGYDTREGSIVQWDSWKVWEGFLSGMLVITADLDYYNINLPFKLRPYVHYIPIRYNNMVDSYSKFTSLSDKVKENIAIQGQKFVLENYTPKSIAKYIIKELS